MYSKFYLSYEGLTIEIVSVIITSVIIMTGLVSIKFAISLKEVKTHTIKIYKFIILAIRRFRRW